MAKLTNAGREMIAQFLAQEDRGRGLIKATDGQMYMSLPKGEGAAKATLEKLKRDGLAQGRWNSYGTSIMRPTDAGRQAHAECGFFSKFRVGDELRYHDAKFPVGWVRSIDRDAKGIFYIVGFGTGKYQTRQMVREEAVTYFDQRRSAAA